MCTILLRTGLPRTGPIRCSSPDMSSYDFYIMLRGLDELLERFMPLLIIAVVGIVAAVLLRIWLRHRAGSSAVAVRVAALEARVDRLEAGSGPGPQPDRQTGIHR